MLQAADALGERPCRDELSRRYEMPRLGTGLEPGRFRHLKTGGGMQAILYALRKARDSGGVLPFYRRMRARNTCKTCALGMSAMKDEAGGALEVCKKSFQAQAADMQPPIEP